MKNTTDPLPEPTEAEIQSKAYHLWVEGGCQSGVELDNWLAAKELLRHHHGVAPHTDHSQRRTHAPESGKTKRAPAPATAKKLPLA
jgi:hypothetical protein